MKKTIITITVITTAVLIATASILPASANTFNQELYYLLGESQDESIVKELDHAHFNLPLTDEILTSYQEISAVILPAREVRDTEVQAAKQAFTDIQIRYPLYRASSDEQYAEWKAIHDEASAEEQQRISDAWAVYINVYNEEIAKFHQVFLNEYQSVMDEIGIDTETREWSASINEELDTLTVTIPYATADEVAILKANTTIQNLTLDHLIMEQPTETEETTEIPSEQTIEGEEIFGDIDGDGIINATDAAYILQYSAELGAGQISVDFKTYMKEIRKV